MKIMNELKQFGRNCVEAVKSASKSVKMAVGGAIASMTATASQATDVAFDSATKTFTGEFDLSPYYSAIGVVIAAIAVVAAIKLAINQFKRV